VNAAFRALRARLAEISDLARAGGVLAWDQKVTMPPGGHPARAEALATLSRVVHEKFVDDEVGALLERLRPLEESLEHDSDDASLIRVARRDWEKQRRVPIELRVELTRAAALGNQVWIEARATNDFAKFLPALQRNLELKRRYVECFEWDDSPYTPLLDDFEPHMKTSEVAEIFGTIRPVLAELVREAPDVDASFFDRSFPADRQEEFCKRILDSLGLDAGS
jgi:carboxypeptidase Taq